MAAHQLHRPGRLLCQREAVHLRGAAPQVSVPPQRCSVMMACLSAASQAGPAAGLSGCLQPCDPCPWLTCASPAPVLATHCCHLLLLQHLLHLPAGQQPEQPGMVRELHAGGQWGASMLRCFVPPRLVAWFCSTPSSFPRLPGHASHSGRAAADKWRLLKAVQLTLTCCSLPARHRASQAGAAAEL